MKFHPLARLALSLLVVAVGCSQGSDLAPRNKAPGVAPPPAGAAWDYQLAEGYTPADGVAMVVRDWYGGEPLAESDSYSVCYVNAFQTQPDSSDTGSDRTDLATAWPQELVLRELGEDPGWPGEYLIDISTEQSRAESTAWVEPMLDTCADKGFRAVEFDNLDSWTRFSDTQTTVPFGEDDAVAYATMLVEAAHARGLAAGQKNTPQIDGPSIGFDFAIAEECGAFDECASYTDLYGGLVFDVEYTDDGFETACSADGVTALRRDVDLTVPGSPDHVDRRC